MDHLYTRLQTLNEAKKDNVLETHKKTLIEIFGELTSDVFFRQKPARLKIDAIIIFQEGNSTGTLVRGSTNFMKLRNGDGDFQALIL